MWRVSTFVLGCLLRHFSPTNKEFTFNELKLTVYLYMHFLGVSFAYQLILGVAILVLNWKGHLAGYVQTSRRFFRTVMSLDTCPSSLSSLSCSPFCLLSFLSLSLSFFTFIYLAHLLKLSFYSTTITNRYCDICQNRKHLPLKWWLNKWGKVYSIKETMITKH